MSRVERAGVAAPSRGRIGAIDGMRGLAALAVLVFHTYNTTAPGWESITWMPTPLRLLLAHLGHLAVVLFFVLSGLLVGSPFVRAALGHREQVHLRRYAVARIARIFPAWWLMLVVVVLVGNRELIAQPSRLALFATLQQNYDSATVGVVVPHGWSLAIEVSFYAALPVAALLASAAIKAVAPERRGQVVAALLSGAVLAALAFSWVWFNLTPHGHPDRRPLSFSLFAYGASFALGMLVALVAETAHGIRPRSMIRRWAAPVALASWLIGLTAAPTIEQELIPFVCALLTLGVVFKSSAGASGVLAFRPLRRLGEISYGVYLWHLPLLYAGLGLGIVPRDQPVWTPVVVAGLLALSALVAELSWRLLEQPIVSFVAVRGRPRSTGRTSLPSPCIAVTRKPRTHS